MPKSVQVCSTKASVSRNVSLSRRRAIRSRAVNFPCSGGGGQQAGPSARSGYFVVLRVNATLAAAQSRGDALLLDQPEHHLGAHAGRRRGSVGVADQRRRGRGYCLLGARIDRVVEAERSEAGTGESLHGNPHHAAVIASDARPRETMVAADGGTRGSGQSLQDTESPIGRLRAEWACGASRAALHSIKC